MESPLTASAEKPVIWVELNACRSVASKALSWVAFSAAICEVVRVATSVSVRDLIAVCLRAAICLGVILPMFTPRPPR